MENKRKIKLYYRIKGSDSVQETDLFDTENQAKISLPNGAEITTKEDWDNNNAESQKAKMIKNFDKILQQKKKLILEIKEDYKKEQNPKLKKLMKLHLLEAGEDIDNLENNK